MPLLKIRIRLLLPRVEEVSGLGISFAAHLALISTLLIWGSARADLLPPLATRPVIAVDLRASAPAPAPAPAPAKRPEPETKSTEPPKPKPRETPPPPKRTRVDAPTAVVEELEGTTAQPAELPAAEPPPSPPAPAGDDESGDAADDLADAAEIPGGVAGAVFEDTGFRADWYVSAVQVRLQAAWRDRPVLPAGREAMRVVVAFRILRDGTVIEPHLAIPSGYTPLDHSALRAVQSLGRLPALPPGYDKQSVPARFVFELVPAGSR